MFHINNGIQGNKLNNCYNNHYLQQFPFHHVPMLL